MARAHPEAPKDAILLRREDIQAMVNDGSIGQQHFLIKMMADELLKTGQILASSRPEDVRN